MPYLLAMLVNSVNDESSPMAVLRLTEILFVVDERGAL
jgi:hypothetical protein